MPTAEEDEGKFMAAVRGVAKEDTGDTGGVPAP